MDFTWFPAMVNNQISPPPFGRAALLVGPTALLVGPTAFLVGPFFSASGRVPAFPDFEERWVWFIPI